MATVNLGTIEAVLRLKDELSTQMARTGRTVGTAVSKLNTKFNEATAGLQRYAGPLGLAAVGAAALKLVNDVRAVGTELVDLRAKTGVSLQGLQELKFASEQVGVGFDQTTMAVVRMGRRLAAELPEATKWMDMLGLSTSTILEMEPAEGFQAIVESIAAIENPAQQAAAAMGIFGDAGLQMLPLIRSDLDATIERFHALGGVIEDDVLEAGKKLDDTMTDLSAAFGGATAELGGALMPAMQWLAEALTKLPLLIQLMAQGWITSMARMWASILELVSKIPLIGDKFQGVAEEVRSFATYYEQAMVDTTLQIDNLISKQEEQVISTKSVTDSTLEMGDATRQVTFEFQNMTDALDDFQQQADESASEFPWAPAAFVPAVEGLGTVRDEFGFLPSAFVPVTEGVGDLNQEFMDWNDVSGMTQSALSSVGDILGVFGVEVDSTIGRVASLVSTILDFASNLSNLPGLIGNVAGTLGQLFGGGGGGGGGGGMVGMGLQVGTSLLGGGGAAGAGGLGSMGGLAGGAGGMAGTIGGGLASAGSAIGGAASSVIAGIAPVLAAIPVAGWIALAGIATVLAVKAIFGGPSNFEQAGTELGNSFGEEFDENLRWHLVNTMEETGVDMQTAMQLSLGEISKRVIETGGDLDNLSVRMRDTFAFLERGEIDTAQAAQILGESVHQIIPHIDELGETGRAALEGIINDAINLGIEFEGMAELAQALGMDIGMSVEGGVNQASIAIERLANQLDDLEMPEFELGPGAGGGTSGGGGSRAGISAQSGFDSGLLSSTTLFPPILAHPGERLTVQRPGDEGMNLTYSPRNSVAIQGGSPQQMENQILSVLINAVRNDVRSLVGEITRKQQRS